MAVVVLLTSGGARAEMDSFLLGNGQNGAYSVPTGSWMVINSYARVTATANAGTSTISVSTTAGFAANRLVMVLQTTGLTPPPTTNGGTPIVITNQRVGQYELARISSVGANQLTFSRPLWQSYDANVTQVVSVPEYTTVTVQQNAGIYAAAWDGSTGGVLAFLATGAVTNDGWIGAWDGFWGGPTGGGNSGYGCTGIDDANGASKGEGVAAGRYPTAHGYGYLANGGGGGICHNSGGGGGGLGGVGGKGGRPCRASGACDDSAGDYGGRGGAQISFDPRTRLFLGGGGGGGEQDDLEGTAGGSGGGIVFIRAASMARTSAGISAGVDSSANGAANAGQDGAGGGGAGGTISVRLTGTLDCDWLGADGAAGGNIGETYHGPGGGGAGGVVLVQSAGAATCNFGAYGGAHGVTPPSSSAWGTGFDAQDGSPGSVTTLTSAYTRPPAPVISSPGSQTNNTQPTLSGTVNRASTPIQMFVDNVPAGRTTSGSGVPSSWSLQVPSVLSTGTHTIVVQSEVEGAASTPTTLTLRVTVNTNITGNPPSLTNSTSATFTFAPSPASSFTFACKLDGAASYTACTSPKSYSGLSNGSHTFRVHTVDPQGYAGPDATYTWTVDTVAPVVTITGGPADPTNQTNASFTFTVNDAGATVQCQLDGGGFSACTSPKSYAGPLAQGSHTFTVRATDGATNVGTDSWTWTIDTTAPTVTINSGPPARTNSTSATFQFTVTGATTIECRLDTGSWAACTSPHSLTAPEGAHTFYVRGTDAVGNSSTASRAWTVDLTPPTTSFSATPPSVTNATSASFAFSANESNSTFECSLDGAAFSSCTSPTSPTIGEGSHTYSVRATDLAGNLGSAATFGWTVDLTPPDTWLVSGPGATVGMGDVTIVVSSTEGGSTFECNLDSAGYSPCSATYVVTSPVQGTHIVFIVAIDPAGNPDPTPLAVNFAVDFDRDGDGLTDDAEVTLGTDPARADTDNDGLIDGTEVNDTGTSPLDDDSDDDGLIDGTEVYLGGTSPLNPDTDGDGLTDGQERGLSVPQGTGTAGAVFVSDADPATRTDPLKTDTDDDGILDGIEDADRNGRVDPGETDPAKADTDGDGLPDGLERITAFNPTDPCNPDTDGDGLQDGTEDANHNGVVEETETDPNKADTDHGGVNDGLEVRGGTNPLDPTDDYQVRGGGCSSAGASLAPCALLALVGLAFSRRRREAPPSRPGPAG